MEIEKKGRWIANSVILIEVGLFMTALVQDEYLLAMMFAILLVHLMLLSAAVEKRLPDKVAEQQRALMERVSEINRILTSSIKNQLQLTTLVRDHIDGHPAVEAPNRKAAH